MIQQLEPLQDHPERQRCFMHRKATADASALAIAERLPGIGRAFGLSFAAEILRIEHIRVRAPYGGIPMQCHHQYCDEGTFPQLVLAADGFVFQR